MIRELETAWIDPGFDDHVAFLAGVERTFKVTGLVFDNQIFFPDTDDNKLFKRQYPKKPAEPYSTSATRIYKPKPKPEPEFVPVPTRNSWIDVSIRRLQVFDRSPEYYEYQFKTKVVVEPHAIEAVDSYVYRRGEIVRGVEFGVDRDRMREAGEIK